MTQTEDLRMWRKILGIDPTVKEVFKYLSQFSMMGKAIRLRIINRYLRDENKFRRDLISAHNPEVTKLSHWLFEDEKRVSLMRRHSDWIIRCGFGERVMEELLCGKSS